MYIEFMKLGEHCQLTSFQSDNLFNLIFQADGEGDMSIHSCKVESCAGWRLNKLPEVKRFIHEDLEKNYERTTFKKIPGTYT